jgi:DNA gyrase subunit A
MTILGQMTLSTEERDAYLRQAAKLRQEGTSAEEEIGGEEEEASTNTLVLLPERMEELAASEQFILTVTEKGFGKRSSAYGYRTTGRGGIGMDSIIVNVRNGGVVASFPVEPTDQIMLVTDRGQLIRCPVHDIRIAGRRTQGVTIFRVGEGEKVVAVSCIPVGENGEEEGDTGEDNELGISGDDGVME